MKRSLLILLVGIAGGAASFCGVYFALSSSAKNLERKAQPELAWLKDEFGLTDAAFREVEKLHQDYLPLCRAKCLEIEAQNAALQKLLASATNTTPEIERALRDASRLRAECQSAMLRHFFSVSEAMPRKAARKYLSFVTGKAFLAESDMSEQHHH